MEEEPNKETERKIIINRYIARTLGRIEEMMKLPNLVKDEIKRQYWFLADDLENFYKGKKQI